VKNLAVSVFFISFVTLISQAAFSSPIAFERNFTNNAWGHYNNGCVIDEQRFVYIYAAESDKPMTMINRMPVSSYRRAQRLLQIVARSPYEVRRVAVDAGVAVWSGVIDGRSLRIKEFGDTVGGRTCAEADELVELIEAFCPRFIGQ
jgi:hypothetical protein